MMVISYKYSIDSLLYTAVSSYVPLFMTHSHCQAIN